MSLSKIGSFVKIVSEKNIDNNNYPFFGINIQKEFMPSIANTTNVDKTKYKIVRKNRFVFSGMQTGRDNCIRIGLYLDNNPILVSPAYITFEIDETKVLSKYFFMIFNSTEKDRYGAFLSDSSVRSNLDWDRFCDIDLEIPPLHIQQKYVDVYDALIQNLKSYESKLNDFKMVYEGYIEELRRKLSSQQIKNYIKEINIRNEQELIKNAIGISKDGIFNSERTAKKDSIKSCKIINKNNLIWASQTTCGIGIGAVGIYEKNEPSICAPTCTIIETNKELNPYYLLAWLRRTEFWRYAKFVGSGVIEKFDSNLLGEVKIPIPNIEIQNNIANIYKIIGERTVFIKKIKEIISNICPILIKGSILEMNGGK